MISSGNMFDPSKDDNASSIYAYAVLNDFHQLSFVLPGNRPLRSNPVNMWKPNIAADSFTSSTPTYDAASIEKCVTKGNDS